MQTRTLTTKKGKTVETTMTDPEALAVLRQDEDAGEFSRDLVKKADKYGLSHDQWVWVHVLASEKVAGGQEKPEHLAGFGAAIAYLKAAREAGLKWPKVRLVTLSNAAVVLSITGTQSKRPGTINITDGAPYGQNVWYGRINEGGELEQSRKMTDEVFELLSEFTEHPGETAAAQGALTSRCCFCGLELRTKESVGAGYGPDCAAHWGLPWGASTAATYESEKTKAVEAAKDAAANGYVADETLAELVDAATI